MPDSLNARMAAALAPVLGETAVYRKQLRCRQHGTLAITSSYERGTWCADCDRMEIEHGENIEWVQQSVDFADPAVGWGVLERYLKATSSYLTLGHNTEGSVREAHVFPDLAYQFVHEGYADTAWGAVIMAWARAMGVGEVSGDA